MHDAPNSTRRSLRGLLIASAALMVAMIALVLLSNGGEAETRAPQSPLVYQLLLASGWTFYVFGLFRRGVA